MPQWLAQRSQQLLPEGWNERPGTMLTVEDIEGIVAFVKRKAIESYKNGLTATTRIKGEQRRVAAGK